jgi:hypothetical protein
MRALMGAGLSLTADIRKFFAFLSACGLIASIVAYIDTFSVVRMDFIFRLWIIFIVGWMFLLAPIYFLEYPASQTSSFLWKGFTRGMPSWVGSVYWPALANNDIAYYLVWFA